MIKEVISKIKNISKKKVQVSYEKDFSKPRGKMKIEVVDKADDLNHQMVEKFLESINELVQNSEKANVKLEIEFKDSILTCRVQDGIIALNTIWPKDSNAWNEVAHFNHNAFPLREYLNDNVRTNEDIVELEKTMIRLL